MRALVLLGLLGCTSPAAPEPSTLLVSDYRANAIFRYDGVTGEFLGTFAAGSEQRVDRPAGVRLGPDGQLYTAGFGRGDVVRYEVPTGRMMDVFYWDTRLLEEPVELAFDGAELVVLGNDTNNIVVVAPDGSLARTFGYPLIQGAHDFVIDAARRVLVATDTAIQVWDLATGTRLGTFGERDLLRATSIAQREGVTYVADWDRDCIMTFPEGRVLVAGLRDPINIDFHGDELYVLDATGIQRFDPETGEPLGVLVHRDEHLQWPRAFAVLD